ncbi:MAG: HEAT repeat domain-containing protein [Polyangiaceae bacterium]|nr:HEAT repeat domain-containing protein [Polyangiaceae bacterium]
MFALSPLPRTLDAALRDARATKVEVRRSALRDLVRYAEGTARARVLACLVETLAGDRDPGVRAEAARALADASAAEAVDALLAAAQDESLWVRQLALVALGEVAEGSSPAVRAALEAALAHEAPALRYQALIGLARLTAEDVTAALMAATRDQDAEVRHVAIRLLEERWVPGTAADSDPVPGELPAEVATRIRALLRDDVPKVRLAAAILLGRLGNDAGQDCLVAAIDAASGTFDPEDEHAAVELAGALRLLAARRGLSRRAFGWLGFSLDPTSFPARVALARCGEPRARNAILRGLAARSRDARTAAVVAAGRARLAAAGPLISAMQGDPTRAEPAVVAEALARLRAAGDEA